MSLSVRQLSDSLDWISEMDPAVVMARENGGLRDYRFFTKREDALKFVSEQRPRASVTIAKQTFPFVKIVVSSSSRAKLFDLAAEVFTRGKEFLMISISPAGDQDRARPDYLLTDNIKELEESLQHFDGQEVVVGQEPSWWDEVSYQGDTPTAWEVIIPSQDGTIVRGRY
jgi:hypothetical protein